MVSFNKHLLQSFYITSTLEDHPNIKDVILGLIDMDDPTQNSERTPYSNSINKKDWNQATDFNRIWASIFVPKLLDHLNSISTELGYKNCRVNQLWYQQYVESDVHHWHVHGDNFTGVYYLELPDGTPKTEIIDPYTQTDIITPDVQEGTILLFPSYTVHRAPMMKTTKRKTIISFNFGWVDPNYDMFEITN
jgi:hypothetical protein